MNHETKSESRLKLYIKGTCLLNTNNSNLNFLFTYKFLPQNQLTTFNINTITLYFFYLGPGVARRVDIVLRTWIDAVTCFKKLQVPCVVNPRIFNCCAHCASHIQADTRTAHNSLADLTQITLGGWPRLSVSLWVTSLALHHYLYITILSVVPLIHVHFTGSQP